MRARAFLASTPWSDAQIHFLAGDASNRKYYRLTRGGQTAILMDAPPDKGEDVRPFMRIAQFLTEHGFSAPIIHAEDKTHGFLVLEDLGDDLFARVIAAQPMHENKLYTCATELLVRLHETHPPEGLESYTPETMGEMSILAVDWYATNSKTVDPDERTLFHKAIVDGLTLHAPECDVLIQRDYHAENLLWLPERAGVAQVGLLDFQDAMLGHRAYDLVSLLQDARRDVPPAIERMMLDHYIAAAKQDRETFERAYYWLGVQRNLRILGVFARLCIRDGKAGYIPLIPRVWAYLERGLKHPSLAKLRDHVQQSLPQPTPEILSKLTEKCATHAAQ